MASYQVTAPLVIVRDLTGDSPGPDIYIYQGGRLPAFLTKEQLANLEGMVEKVDEPKADDPAYDPASGAPGKSAKKGDWEAFARSKGATDEDLDGKSKDDLIAAYGG
jgi:hypothetical protein